MNEETKLPTTRDCETEKDKGRCAPAPGSAIREAHEALDRLPQDFAHAMFTAWKWGFFVPFCAFCTGVLIGMIAMKIALTP